jgi:EmrB/QacA subfamily drug resistance transporter
MTVNANAPTDAAAAALPGATPQASARAAWRTFGLTSAAVFLVTLDATAVVAAYAALRDQFGQVSMAWLSWTLNAYTIVYAALLVPAGRMADLLGRKRVFMHGLVLFTAASALCAFAPGVGWLVAARVLQAMGAAMLTPAALALVLNAFPRDKRAAAVGLFSAIGALAAAVGPAFGSWVIEQGSWRWIFLINAPLGIVAWVLARRGLAESTSPETGARPDLPGIALLVAGAATIALGIVMSERWGWLSGPQWAATWATLGSGLALIALFVRWAWGRPAAALDLSLFRDSSFAWVNLATLVFGVAFTMMFLSSFLLLMGVWGYSQGLAGLAVTPGPLMVIPVAIASSRLAGRIGHRPMLVGGSVLYAVAQLWVGWRLGSQPDYLGVWLPAQILGGAAVGLVLPALSGAAVAHLGPTRFGVGGGVNNALRQLGGAIGAALTVALVGRAGATWAQFQTVYLLLAGLGLLTAVLCLPVRTRPAAAVTLTPRPAGATS